MRRETDRSPIRRRKRLLALGLAACAAFSCLTGCGQGGRDGGGETESLPKENLAGGHEAAVGKRIGLSFPASPDGQADERAVCLEELFREAGLEVSVLYANEPESGDNASAGAAPGAAETSGEAAGTAAPKEGQQARDVNTLIGAGCDVLLVVPDGISDLGALVGSAREAGIPVISYDRLIEGTGVPNYYIGLDAYRMGVLQGEYVSATLGLGTQEHSRQHTVEFVAGEASDYRAGYLFNGVYDVLQPYFDAGTLTVPSGEMTYGKVSAYGAETEAVRERLQKIFKENYDKAGEPGALICPSDAAAKGAIAAAESYFGGGNKVVVTGAGASKDALSALAEGKQAMTLFADPKWEALVARDVVLTLLDGDPADASLIEAGGYSFECSYDTASYDNGAGIVPSFLISPRTITKGNLDTLEGGSGSK